MLSLVLSFSFSCREQGKSAIFKLVFHKHHTPKSSLKRKVEKANFMVFVSGTLLQSRFPLATVWADQPRKSFGLSADTIKPTLPDPLTQKFHTNFALLCREHHKPPFENIYQFSERWNWSNDLVSLPSYYLHIVSLQTDRQSDPRARKSGKPFSHQFSRRRAEENFHRKLAGATAFTGISINAMSFGLAPKNRTAATFEAIWVNKAIKLLFLLPRPQ